MNTSNLGSSCHSHERSASHSSQATARASASGNGAHASASVSGNGHASASASVSTTDKASVRWKEIQDEEGISRFGEHPLLQGLREAHGSAYTVQAGDTLSEIASRYGTTYQALAQANGIANPDLILPGQQFQIPGGGGGAGGGGAQAPGITRMSDGGGSSDTPVGPIPTGEHLTLIDQALQKAGVPITDANRAAVNSIVEKESSWNPNAVNNWDSNAQAGHPSKGLMQTIPSTFQEYALPGYNSNIFDPLSNLIAGIRYSVSRYGALGNVPGVKAMANGGSYVGY